MSTIHVIKINICTLLAIFVILLLAHQWGAYAIPLTLSVVCRPLSVVCRVSSVSTITARNNEVIKSIFSANVYHVPGLCLLGIDGAPYISHKIMARKSYFRIFHFFSEQPAGGASYYTRRLPKPRPS